MLLVITLVEHAKTTICIAPEVTLLACVQGMLIVAVAHHIQVKKQHYDRNIARPQVDLTEKAERCSD